MLGQAHDLVLAADRLEIIEDDFGQARQVSEKQTDDGLPGWLTPVAVPPVSRQSPPPRFWPS